MAADEQASQHAVHDLTVADNYFANLVLDAAVGLAKLLGPFGHRRTGGHEFSAGWWRHGVIMGPIGPMNRMRPIGPMGPIDSRAILSASPDLPSLCASLSSVARR